MKQTIAILILVVGAFAQSTISGTATLSGLNSIGGSSQYTHVWAYSPPNGVPDFTTFKDNVMALPVVDGVSLLESWSSIDTGYGSTPCGSTLPDQCQPDPMIPNTYHYYNWGTYDATGSGTPVMQWLTTSFGGVHKKVNLLITGSSAGATNGTTPHYVTSSTWTSQFTSPNATYARQDVVNAINNATDCSTVPWSGTTLNGISSSNVSWSGHTVTVTAPGCCSASSSDQSSLLQTGDLIWVSDTAVPGIGTGPGGIAITSVTTTPTATFTYTSTGAAGTPSGNLNYVSAPQSWAVPYEHPYKSALKAFWAAVVSHYGPTFTVGGTNYFSQLNYFRFGGSVGSEWFPYCVTDLESTTYVPAPYTYTKSGTTGSVVGWLDYYQEMTAYLQTLGPAFKVIGSINAAANPATGMTDYTYGNLEAGYNVTSANGYGIFNGFGSQGLSAKDWVNCSYSGNNCDNSPPGTLYSASNWHPMFLKYGGTGVPLELQQAAISYPGDTMCSTSCGFGSGYYAGDLPTFLDLAVKAGLTDIEIYWRDLDLAFDSGGYCTVSGSSGSCGGGTASCGGGITLGGQITATNQFCFFQSVGQSASGSYCGINGVGHPPYQPGATGTCSYANAIVNAHGAH